MNTFGLSIAVRAAREWATNDQVSFSRFFDLSLNDQKWLVAASEELVSDLCQMATSPFQISFEILQGGLDAVSRTIPSASVGLVTTILTSIADDLKKDLRIAMINWGITSYDKAMWLAESSIQERLRLAMKGSISFSLRCETKHLSAGAQNPTAKMAALLRVISSPRKAS